MEHLLLLVHRIPYPPNKGDKIRSYHLLKHLSQHYQVHLGTFVDDPNDWQHVETIKALCRETCFVPLKPAIAKLKSARALVSGGPMSLEYYRSPVLAEWVSRVTQQHAVDRVIVFSSVMAQYASGGKMNRRIVDFVDIDSEKWRQYSAKKDWPMRWLYRREAHELLGYERQIARDFDASLFVSEAEAAFFKQLAPESVDKIGFFTNGVDTDYFSPHREYSNPYLPNTAPVAFTGAMDYWPNIDAVKWFTNEVFPAVLAKHPSARFYIVGSRPSPEVQALASLPGVVVTGTVPDVRPYLAHARLCIAPLRIARGVQNKVLEAMSMGKCTVVSQPALEGINATPGQDLLLAEHAHAFTSAICVALEQTDSTIGTAARLKVEAQYGWASNLAPILPLLESTSQHVADGQPDQYEFVTKVKA